MALNNLLLWIHSRTTRLSLFPKRGAAFVGIHLSLQNVPSTRASPRRPRAGCCASSPKPGSGTSLTRRRRQRFRYDLPVGRRFDREILPGRTTSENGLNTARAYDQYNRTPTGFVISCLKTRNRKNKNAHTILLLLAFSRWRPDGDSTVSTSVNPQLAVLNNTVCNRIQIILRYDKITFSTFIKPSVYLTRWCWNTLTLTFFKFDTWNETSNKLRIMSGPEELCRDIIKYM